MKRFKIDYTLSIELSENELFPDGTNDKREITIEDVYELIRRHGGMNSLPTRIISDWNLSEYGVLDVTEVE